jgi:dTDP-4-amino-4,6-dideoxygalactose transaminase
VISTNEEALAERCRIGRDYANPGDYDARFVGLNARMSELHAALALRSLDGLDGRIDRRNVLAGRYRAGLSVLPGISFPSVPPDARSTYKDFTVLVEGDRFGMDAAQLARALAAEGIATKRYYAPPVHLQQAYLSKTGTNGHLKVTERAAGLVLTLPLWSDMTEGHIDRVVEAVSRIHASLGSIGGPAPTPRWRWQTGAERTGSMLVLRDGDEPVAVVREEEDGSAEAEGEGDPPHGAPPLIGRGPHEGRGS